MSAPGEAGPMAGEAASGEGPEPLDGHADRLLARSWRGAAWVLASSSAALVLGFGTNILLGRSSPEALGLYGLLLVTLSVVTTFFVLGGTHVVITYLPGLAGAHRRRFLGTYAAVVAGGAALLLAASLVEPRLLRALYGPATGRPVAAYLALLLPAGVAQTLVWAVLQARMQLRALALSQQAVPLVTFTVVAAAVATGGPEGPGLLTSRSFLLAAVLGANLASLAVGGALLARRRGGAGGPVRLRPWLPPGFWRFTLTFHLATVLYFVVRSGDQIFVIRDLGLTDLGFYRSALVVAQLVAWFPMVMDWTIYPTLCNLRAADQAGAYRRFADLNALGTSLIGVVVLLWSGELLGMFGRSVAPQSRAVLILLAGSVLVAAPLVNLNHSVVISRTRAGAVLGANAASAAVAVAAYTVLGRRFGLVGVAAAFAVVQVAMLVLSAALTARLGGIRPPAAAVALTLAAVVWGLGGALAWPGTSVPDLAIRAVLTVAFLPAVWLARLVDRRATIDLVRLVATRMRPGAGPGGGPGGGDTFSESSAGSSGELQARRGD